jgi:hypothetical protein
MAAFVNPTYNEVSDAVNATIPALQASTDELALRSTVNAEVAGATGNVAFDLADGYFLTLDATAATTGFSVTLANPPVNVAVTVIVKNGATARAITFPAGVGARTGTNGGTNQYILTYNGTAWATIL